MLEQIKTLLGISGEYQDELLKLYIEEVKDFMLNAGVSKEVIEFPSSYGVIARGVLDIWNYGAGEGQLSPYFIQRVTQLSLKGDNHV